MAATEVICIALAAVAFALASGGATARESDGIITLEPASLPKPYKNRFSHGKIIPSNAEWLYTAGQTGVDVDGTIGANIEEQAELAMRNLYNIVKEAGMDSTDVVKMTIYYVDPAHLPIIVAARNKYFGEDFRPASTAVGVSALARPQYLVEVELIAARIPAD
ncbi:MAG: RidA family protein [Gammaproteobacteria bacterium]|nr:RidA family protein [Gammaproteobacteria bacterium]